MHNNAQIPENQAYSLDFTTPLNISTSNLCSNVTYWQRDINSKYCNCKRQCEWIKFPNLHSFKWFSVGKGSPGVNEDSMRCTLACTITYNINTKESGIATLPRCQWARTIHTLQH